MAVLRVIHVSMECHPFSKVGGMADVVGALPAALQGMGVEGRILTPYYPQLYDGEIGPELASFEVWVGDAPHRVRLLEAGPHAVLVDQPTAFDRPGVYDDPRTGAGFQDSLFRCLILQQATRLALRYGHIRADVVHCHDNHTGLVPAYLMDDGGPPTVLTIHNLAYQGLYGGEHFWLTGLASDRFHASSPFEYYGDLSLMKAGITHASVVTTVSPSYAAEILTPEFGHGLDGALRWLGDRLIGVLNGIDTEVWDPATDTGIAANYSAADPAGKRECRRALCKETGLDDDPDAPLLGMVTRVTYQKGLDLVGALLPHIARRGAQLVLLGSGDQNLLDLYRGAQGRWPGRFALVEGYNEPLAHRIYAGTDVFLMPSRFEPCGLSQMYAMRYGSVPVTTSMGGLKDTVEPFDSERGTGTGVLAHWATSDSICGALDHALDLFEDKARFEVLRSNAMERDFSWARSAEAYAGVYRGLAG
jgi:starch synthase